MEDLGFLQAHICRSGHVIDDSIGKSQLRVGLGHGHVTITSGLPVDRASEAKTGFCEICGSEVLTKCPGCGKQFRGVRYQNPNAPLVRHEGDYRRPSYCSQCGNAYPWTEWDIKELNAAFIESLDRDEGVVSTWDAAKRAEVQRQFQQSVVDIIHDLPNKVRAVGFFDSVVASVVADQVLAFMKTRLVTYATDITTWIASQ